jgi:antagonist of KipI
VAAVGSILVKKPGLLTTVQDAGRIGYQQFGVPVSGVMDHLSHRIGNLLVGNPENGAVLELSLLGPELVFQTDTVISVTGGDLGVHVNGEPLSLWTSVRVSEGDTLTCKGIKKGCRAYLAVAGGIQVPTVMGSLSTYTRGKIGGCEGRALKAGDVLTTGEPTAEIEQLAGRSLTPAEAEYPREILIRVIPGPQDDAFTPEGIETFYSSPYAVTNECDRMGYRLEGAQISHISGGDMISDGIAMGAVQVPGHGMPIVMMADRQTTGGYTKIANVITVDLPKMAQAKPGDQITFHRITVEEAQQLLQEQEKTLSGYRKQLGISLPEKPTPVPASSPAPDPAPHAGKKEVRVVSRKELFRYQKGGRQYCVAIEEIEES